MIVWMSRGNYEFLNLNLNYCSDKSVLLVNILLLRFTLLFLQIQKKV